VANKRAGRKAGKLLVRQTDTNRQAGKQARQADRHVGRQTDRPTKRKTDRCGEKNNNTFTIKICNDDRVNCVIRFINIRYWRCFYYTKILNDTTLKKPFP
jgi:hypothetical protein